MKRVTSFSYLVGTKRLIPDQCAECPNLIRHFEGKKGLFCKTHVSIVDKDRFFQYVYTVNSLDENDPYKRFSGICDLIDRVPRHVKYSETWGGQLSEAKKEGKNEVLQFGPGDYVVRVSEELYKTGVMEYEINRIIEADEHPIKRKLQFFLERVYPITRASYSITLSIMAENVDWFIKKKDATIWQNRAAAWIHEKTHRKLDQLVDQLEIRGGKFDRSMAGNDLRSILSLVTDRITKIHWTSKKLLEDYQKLKKQCKELVAGLDEKIPAEINGKLDWINKEFTSLELIYKEKYEAENEGKEQIMEDDIMLKEQREKLPEFIENIDLIIERENIQAVEKLLSTRVATIKNWKKGKENGGTEPTSSDFDNHEKKVNEYIKAYKNEISKPSSDREMYLTSIRKVSHYANYVLSVYPDLPKMNKVLESCTKMIAKTEDYDQWNLEAAMMQISREYTAAYLEVPTAKKFANDLRYNEELLKKAENKRDKNKYEKQISAAKKGIQSIQNDLQSEADHSQEIPSDIIAANQNNSNDAEINEQVERLESVLISNILPNPYQPRKVFDEEAIQELASSIKSDGLVQPIVVRQTDDGIILVAGERRLRAHRFLNKTHIQAIIKKMSEGQAAAASIIENFQRVNNNPIEIADGIAVMIERVGISQQEAAKMIGVTQAKISQIISLTKLIEPVKQLIVEQKVSSSVGRVIASLSSEIQKQLLETGGLEDFSTEKAQYFVNIYKGLTEIGVLPEEDGESHELRIFKMLYQAECIDLFTSTNTTLNSTNLKSIQPKKVKQFYIPSYLFTGSDQARTLMGKCNITQHYNAKNDLEFRLLKNKDKAAADILISYLQNVIPKKNIEEGQSDLGELVEIPEEERFEIINEKVDTFHQLVLSDYDGVKGTVNEHAFVSLIRKVEDLKDDDIENAQVVIDELESFREDYEEIKQSLIDPNRQKNLLNIQESLNLAEQSKLKFAGTDGADELLSRMINEIKETITNHIEKDSWDLSKIAMNHWKDTNDIIEKLNTKNQDNEADEALEEESRALPVINEKPEKTKTNRVLQIIQEAHEDLHDISVKCSNCKFFNPTGKSYRDRCMNTNVTFHSFKRFKVEGKEAFNCHEYTPKLDVVEQKKKEANLDLTTAMFELLIYEFGYGREYPDLSWAKKEINDLKTIKCTPDEVISLFKEQDEKTKAYWIEVFYRRKQLNNIVQKNLPHPFYTADGNRYIVDHNSMENDDKI